MGCEPAWPDCHVTELRIADLGGRLATPASNPQFFYAVVENPQKSGYRVVGSCLTRSEGF
jgi:hypothetical protein